MYPWKEAVLCKKVFFFLFQLILTEIYYDGFHRTFCDSHPLSELHETDNIYAIETPTPLVEENVENPDTQYLASKYLLLLILNKQGTGSQGKRSETCTFQISWAWMLNLALHISLNFLAMYMHMFSGILADLVAHWLCKCPEMWRTWSFKMIFCTTWLLAFEMKVWVRYAWWNSSRSFS